MSSVWLSSISLSLVILRTETHTNTQTRSDTLCVARGDAADCLLLHVFLRGVEEDRNGQENTQRQRRGRKRKKRKEGG